MPTSRLIIEIEKYLTESEHLVSQRQSNDLLTRALTILQGSQLYIENSIEEIVVLESEIEILKNKVKQNL